MVSIWWFLLAYAGLSRSLVSTGLYTWSDSCSLYGLSLEVSITLVSIIDCTSGGHYKEQWRLDLIMDCTIDQCRLQHAENGRDHISVEICKAYITE